MRQLKLFFVNPFDYIEASKEKILKFYSEHKNALIQQVSEGAPFSALVQPTIEAYEALEQSLMDTAVNVAEQKSKTSIVNGYIQLFVDKAIDFEAGIRDKFKKRSATYLEFYPHGTKAFYNIKKKSIDEVMAQYIAAFENHQAEMSTAKCDELKQIRLDYNNARSIQIQKKSETKNKRALWKDCLKQMNEQAYTNLIAIVAVYKGKPAKLKIFFNQSIVANYRHDNKKEKGL
ncbi:MAG: hypothetical protein HXX18_04590 [Bacteroidetes bacterium]|nr:hypothetical protein [Bacteroidota bacterium]